VFYDAESSYNSFQAKAMRRFRGGFSVNLAFTFAKNMDTATKFNDSFQIPWQFPEIEHALSGLDRPRTLAVGWVWMLPFGKGRLLFPSSRVFSAVLGGFQMNGIFRTGDGFPLTITQRNTNTILSAQRPDVIDPSNLGGRERETIFDGNSRRWLIPLADSRIPFKASSNIGIGNLGRNTMRNPGFVNFNLSLFREFHIGEFSKLQFRLEAYNTMNHVNYMQPASTNINDANYGLITNTAAARQVQLGLKYSF
jgi:hypothetical protein